jgi:alpha-L-fucosidase 2
VDDKPDAGWEKWSLPLGNSRFGASLFGRTETDRIQITENSVANPLIRSTSWKLGMGGTRSFGDLIFEFGHKSPRQYKRNLSLDNAVSTVAYEYSGVKYEREYFLSYPDNVLAMRFTASKGNKISFTLAPIISFCGDHCVASGDDCGRSGEVISSNTDIIMRGVSYYYGIKYEGRLRVKAYSGRVYNENGKIKIRNAESVEIFFTCGTNYRMEARVFSENEAAKKLEPYDDPREKVLQTLNSACAKGYEALKKAHREDLIGFGKNCLIKPKNVTNRKY